jgi:hypothetical protein
LWQLSLAGIIMADVSSDVLAPALSCIFIVIATILFITGFLCGNYFSVKFQFFKRKSHTKADQPHQVPEYEDIDAQQITKHGVQGLELKENVAYVLSKSTNKQ